MSKIKRRFTYFTRREVPTDLGLWFVQCYCLRAVLDYLYPPRDMDAQEWQTACEFCHSQVGQELLSAAFNLPFNTVKEYFKQNKQYHLKWVLENRYHNPTPRTDKRYRNYQIGEWQDNTCYIGSNFNITE